MPNDAIETRAQPVALERVATEQLAGHVEAIRQIQREVMVEGQHYGTIPGAKKPSLWKSGAELVLMTFHLRLTDVIIEDLSTEDSIRYRLKTIISASDGSIAGVGLGECSSDEEKYRWRKAVSDAEFQATPAARRRVKYYRDGTADQVRTNPADLANTVLKMGKKRSYVDACLTTTAASDVFTQDPPDGTKPDPKPAAKTKRSGSLASDFKEPGGNELTEDGKIDSVAEETGTNRETGKPWVRWDIWVGGEVHATFSESILKAARDAEVRRADVSVMYEVGKYGRKVIDLVVHDTPQAPAEQPAGPDEPPPHTDDNVPF